MSNQEQDPSAPVNILPRSMSNILGFFKKKTVEETNSHDESEAASEERKTQSIDAVEDEATKSNEMKPVTDQSQDHPTAPVNYVPHHIAKSLGLIKEENHSEQKPAKDHSQDHPVAPVNYVPHHIAKSLGLIKEENHSEQKPATDKSQDHPVAPVNYVPHHIAKSLGLIKEQNHSEPKQAVDHSQDHPVSSINVIPPHMAAAFGFTEKRDQVEEQKSQSVDAINQQATDAKTHSGAVINVLPHPTEAEEHESQNVDAENDQSTESKENKVKSRDAIEILPPPVEEEEKNRTSSSTTKTSTRDLPSTPKTAKQRRRNKNERKSISSTTKTVWIIVLALLGIGGLSYGIYKMTTKPSAPVIDNVGSLDGNNTNDFPPNNDQKNPIINPAEIIVKPQHKIRSNKLPNDEISSNIPSNVGRNDTTADSRKNDTVDQSSTKITFEFVENPKKEESISSQESSEDNDIVKNNVDQNEQNDCKITSNISVDEIVPVQNNFDESNSSDEEENSKDKEFKKNIGNVLAMVMENKFNIDHEKKIHPTVCKFTFNTFYDNKHYRIKRWDNGQEYNLEEKVDSKLNGNEQILESLFQKEQFETVQQLFETEPVEITSTDPKFRLTIFRTRNKPVLNENILPCSEQEIELDVEEGFDRIQLSAEYVFNEIKNYVIITIENVDEISEEKQSETETESENHSHHDNMIYHFHEPDGIKYKFKEKEQIKAGENSYSRESEIQLEILGNKYIHEEYANLYKLENSLKSKKRATEYDEDNNLNGLFQSYSNNKEDDFIDQKSKPENDADSNIEQSKTKEETENKQLKAEKLIIENFNPKQIERRFKPVKIEPYYNFRNNLTIKVQEIGGYQFYLLDVDPASKISTVKQKIQDQKGYSHERQILVYEVQKLENDQTLNYYNITEDEIMYLFLKDEDEITDYNIDNEYKTQSFKTKEEKEENHPDELDSSQEDIKNRIITEEIQPCSEEDKCRGCSHFQDIDKNKTLMNLSDRKCEWISEEKACQIDGKTCEQRISIDGNKNNFKDEDEITDYNIDNEYKTQSFKRFTSDDTYIQKKDEHTYKIHSDELNLIECGFFITLRNDEAYYGLGNCKRHVSENTPEIQSFKISIVLENENNKNRMYKITFKDIYAKNNNSFNLTGDFYTEKKFEDVKTMTFPVNIEFNGKQIPKNVEFNGKQIPKNVELTINIVNN